MADDDPYEGEDMELPNETITRIAARIPSGEFRTLPTEYLVRMIADRYDAREDYKEPWKELVYRVGEQEAERMVDQA